MKAKTAQERKHHARIAELHCLVCGAWPVEVHHITSNGFSRITRDHARVVPLCGTTHHRLGPEAVHVMGHRQFCELHGVNILAEADRLWEESCA